MDPLPPPVAVWWASHPPARVSLAPELGETVDGLGIDFVLTKSVRDTATGCAFDKP